MSDVATIEVEAPVAAVPAAKPDRANRIVAALVGAFVFAIYRTTLSPDVSFYAGMAFDIGGSSWGFTPLLNRGFGGGEDHSYFIEAVVPIRFQDDEFGDGSTAIGFGIHLGVGF